MDRLNDVELANALKSGNVGVIPTDTVYGLVCRADETAVRRLYALKNRDKKPGTVIAANVEQLVELGVPARYLKPVAHFWPNPISIVVPCGPNLDYLHIGKRSLAVRVVSDKDMANLLKKTGPLLTSSANQPGHPIANTVDEAREYFGGQVDFYVDGGGLSGRPPSTVIRIVDDEVEVLRQGAVKINQDGALAIND